MNIEIRLFLSSMALGFVGSVGGAYLLAESLLAPAAIPADTGGLDADLAEVRMAPAPPIRAGEPLMVSVPATTALPLALMPPRGPLMLTQITPSDARPDDGAAHLAEWSRPGPTGADPSW